ncbi:MAG: hypothetical protein KF742_05820 [Cryobacterium sp.]|nr:hypothetical protein [Cryobacterium sp.]MBX3090150.1 hypothetical protein [Cryobacterium sp.]
MDKLTRVSISAVIAICTISLVACTSSPQEVTPTAEASIGRTQPASEPNEIVDLPASYPSDEPLLGKISNEKGQALIGPFSPRRPAVGVYVRCYGIGSIHVDISNAAAFDQPCNLDATDLGSRNVIDIRYAGDFTVEASSSPGNTWALAVTEVDLEADK